MKKTHTAGKRYTVTDGTLVLLLESDGGDYFTVTSPFDPELVTQAKTIEEAFFMAYDAQEMLDQCRSEMYEMISKEKRPHPSRANGSASKTGVKKGKDKRSLATARKRT